VGTKVSAVSRKINTTTHEVLGVLTKGDTQICFFDTPGLMLKKSGFPYNDIKVRNESAWSSVNLYDVLIVFLIPDSRVVRLIERMGSMSSTNQKRVLCMNKVDLVTKKNDLLKVVEEFKDLPGYERRFMISGLKGAGVKDLTKYLVEQAVKRPWDEDPFTMSEEVMKNISLEVVREKLLDYVHQEIPYGIEHRLMGWKELRDGSLRIEQHFITPKISQRKILVGKKGSKIGRIGVEANEELRFIFKRNVHLILMKGRILLEPRSVSSDTPEIRSNRKMTRYVPSLWVASEYSASYGYALRTTTFRGRGKMDYVLQVLSTSVKAVGLKDIAKMKLKFDCCYAVISGKSSFWRMV
ncbi:UNVERIFIED_CONTAM: GTP-binding protein ERG, partial [Sesamum angustifolium]